ncbi:MAG: acyl-CoA thioesterase [Deltaproteobacteria bacterium]|nr:acyl-CoA thioesterase [Deltaproteobacteria bacterium]
MGVVYYANHLRYFEAGRNELMRRMELPYKELEKLGFALPVASVSVEYKSPARYDDELALETTLMEVRHASVRIRYRMTRLADGTLIATGETTHAVLGPDGKVTRIPPELRQILLRE